MDLDAEPPHGAHHDRLDAGHTRAQVRVIHPAIGGGSASRPTSTPRTSWCLGGPQTPTTSKLDRGPQGEPRGVGARRDQRHDVEVAYDRRRHDPGRALRVDPRSRLRRDLLPRHVASVRHQRLLHRSLRPRQRADPRRRRRDQQDTIGRLPRLRGPRGRSGDGAGERPGGPPDGGRQGGAEAQAAAAPRTDAPRDARRAGRIDSGSHTESFERALEMAEPAMERARARHADDPDVRVGVGYANYVEPTSPSYSAQPATGAAATRPRCGSTPTARCG